MSRFETLTYDIDGVQTVVKAIGSGPAVLALHGAATPEGYDWARGLADWFRSICHSTPALANPALPRILRGCSTW